MVQPVLVVVGVVGKATVAHLAMIGLFSSVLTYMFDQMRLLFEGFRAVLTAEGTGPSVDTLMALQQVLPPKRTVTVHADKDLFPSAHV